jgi:choline-glycine betaine transporter
MAYSAPIFYDDVARLISIVVLIVSLIVQAIALIHCVTQRGDGFQAIGTLPKGAWLAILGICFVLTFFGISSPTGIFGLIGLAAALVYLLDVRAGLRDLSDGKGFW